MTRNDNRVGIGAFFAALVGGVQWRLIVIWVLLMLLPTCAAVLPIKNVLGSVLDHSVHSAAWAKQFDMLPMFDAFMHIGKQSAGIQGASALAMLLTLLLAPFLTAMIVATLRAQRGLGFGELMHGGLGDYWRLFRLMLWSLLPFGIAIGIAAAAFGWADKSAEAATLQAVADSHHHIALWIAVLVLVLAHATMESARAQLAADPGLRSATRAFGRGFKMLLSRPLATLGLYLGTSVLGYGLVLLVGMWRIHTPAIGGVGTVLAFGLAQLIVVVLAWQRIARLHGLTTLARAGGGARRGAYPSLATA